MRDTKEQVNEHIADLLDRLWAGWLPGGTAFDTCVAAVVEQTGYVEADVSSQLLAVARECSSPALATLIRAESFGTSQRPERTLVLAAAGVPGVTLSAVTSALFLGAKVQVRPSKDELVLRHWLAHATTVAPELARQVTVIDEIDWDWPDSAIVYGRDETIDLVREHLPAGSALAAYGNREGVAIIGQSADASATADWLPLLSDDVMTFAQRGCMCPQHIYVVGSAARVDAVTDMLELAFSEGYRHHVTPAQRERDSYAARAAADAQFFSHAYEPVTRKTRHGSPVHSRTIASPTGIPELALTVSQLVDRDLVNSEQSTRQTCVIVAVDEHERAELTEFAYHDAGFTRVCTPGAAHHPSPMWTHDGVGRIGPLVKPVKS